MTTKLFTMLIFISTPKQAQFNPEMKKFRIKLTHILAILNLKNINFSELFLCNYHIFI